MIVGMLIVVCVLVTIVEAVNQPKVCTTLSSVRDCERLPDSPFELSYPSLHQTPSPVCEGWCRAIARNDTWREIFRNQHRFEYNQFAMEQVSEAAPDCITAKEQRLMTLLRRKQQRHAQTPREGGLQNPNCPGCTVGVTGPISPFYSFIAFKNDEADSNV